MNDAGTPDDMAASIVEMQALLLGTETIEEFLTELAGLAILTVGEGLSCGITLQPNGRPLTAASTDALAAKVDEVQYGLDQGPCLHALRTGTQVSIEDLASDQRWAAYAATALQHGIRSSLSLPLSNGSSTVGAFNLYSQVAGSFGPTATRRAERFAQNGSGALSQRVFAGSALLRPDADPPRRAFRAERLRGTVDRDQAGRPCRPHGSAERLAYLPRGHRPGDRLAHGTIAD